MSDKCPNITSPEFKVLERLYDKDTAYSIWMARGESLDGLHTRRSELEKALEYKRTNDAKEISELQQRVAEYNELHDTSHSVNVSDKTATVGLSFYPRTKFEISEPGITFDKDGNLVSDGSVNLNKLKPDHPLRIQEAAIKQMKFDEKLLESTDAPNVDVEHSTSDISKAEAAQRSYEQKLLDKAEETTEAFATKYDEDGNPIGSVIASTKDAVDKASSRLYHRKKSLERTLDTANKDKAKQLRKNIDHINDQLDAHNEVGAIISTLDAIENHILHDAAMLADQFSKNKGSLDYDQWQSLHDSIELAELMAADIGSLERAVNPLNNKLYQDTAEYTESLDRVNGRINKAKRLLRDIENSFVESFSQDHNLTAKDTENLKNSIDYDTSFIGRWVTPLRAIKDPVAQEVYRMVDIAKTNARIHTIENLAKLRLAYEEAVDSGIKDTSVFYDRDSNGKLNGYLLTDKKWADYYEAQDASNKSKAESLGLESDRVSDEDYRNATPEQRATIDQISKEFRNKWQTRVGTEWVPNPPNNPKFAEAIKNPAFKKFHDAIISNAEDMNNSLPPSYHSPKYLYMAPQIRKSTAQIFKQNDGDYWSSMMQLANDTARNAGVSKDMQDTEYGQQADPHNLKDSIIRDNFGNPANIPPINFMSKLTDLAELSTDIMGGMAAKNEMASNYYEMMGVAPELNFILKQLGNRNIVKGRFGDKGSIGVESKTYAAVKDFINSNVYGKTSENPTTVIISGKEVNIDKLSKKFIDYARKVNLFMNIPTAVSGYVKGGIFDTTIDTMVGQYTSAESSIKAAKELTLEMPSIVSEAGARFKKNPVSLLVERFGIDKSIREQYKNMDISTRAGRIDSSDFFYGIYSTPDFTVKSKFMLSMMDNTRIVDGKVMNKRTFKDLYKGEKKWSDFEDMSLRKAYDIKDGVMQPIQKFKDMVFTDFKDFTALENAFVRSMEKETAKYSGAVTALDRTALGRRIAGSAIMMHRNWMVSGFTERFGYRYHDDLTDDNKGGTYRAAIDYSKQVIKDVQKASDIITAMSSNWKGLSSSDKIAMKKIAADIGFAVLAYGLAHMVNELVDDEGKQATNFDHYLAYQMNRILMEQQAFLNPASIIDLASSPTAMTNYLASIGDVTELITRAGEELESGPYEGFTRTERALIKKTYLKNMYEMSQFKDKNRFFKSQVMQ